MSSQTTIVGPSSVACLSCRDKHVKCDGKTPTCGRCAESGITCTYVKSRRGFQGRKKKRTLTDVASGMNMNFDEFASNDNFITDPLLPAVIDPVAMDQHTQSTETISIPSMPFTSVDYERLIGIYYRDIHPAHPIVLPRKLYLRDRNILPVPLKMVMAFMASHLTSQENDELRDQAEHIFDATVPEDAFKVQALLLLTLTSYARFERDRGNTALTQAVALASRLGMDRNAFGNGYDPVHQESWRRTYWELYTITGLISLIAGTNFRIRCPEDLLLPGHCEDYQECRIGEMRDLRAMRSRVSLEDSYRWSSFAYKVEAMRIMGSVFEGESDDGSLTDVQVQALGASITGFILSLPDDLRTPVKDDGGTNEVMSCALMIINLAGVCLHYPRSSLAGQSSFRTVCGNDRKEKFESPDERFHRAAALRYANGLSKLISSRQSLRTLTPCFSCSIAFAAAVHLAAILPRDSSADQHREHIQLELSALNVVSSIWPIGGVVKAQLAQYSREVLSINPQPALQAINDAQGQDTFSLANEPWLDDLTSQFTSGPSEGFLFNLMDPNSAHNIN